LSSGEPDAKISLWFLIYLEALYFMFKVIIIDRIRKAKSILVACLKLFFRFSCPNFDSEKIRGPKRKERCKEWQ
jgi:hypothetical protein